MRHAPPRTVTVIAGQGNPAFKRSSNTVMVTGPGKGADIRRQLVRGAQGPRELQILVLP